MMKRLLQIVCLLALLLTCRTGVVHAGQPLRILSYNIWDGFENAPERREQFIQWMKEQAPDVIAYQELVGMTEKELAELAAQYGHPYVAIAKEEGYPVGLSSKEPIEVITKQIEGYWHGMLHARSYGLDFVVIHLSPFEWEYRLKEAHQITDYIREKQLDKYLILGDFNSVSPFDADGLEKYEAQRLGSIAYDRKNEHVQNLRGEQYDHSVMSTFLSTGATDICRMFTSGRRKKNLSYGLLYQKTMGRPGSDPTQ
ncbi:MAG: endonuclease/exonuclease/phosphatase family protein [Tannerellaceae bacterium]|nr:endonuclease/exonuclease/phosphatase family protein [Tannerellaceae bacterium]MCD8264950.1 endonuclease/exonuclease/phosphatase family protein [Tannerellaceae bacterium]